MKLLETHSGVGTLAAENGELERVHYQVLVHQQEIPVKPFGAIPGLKSITGSINPVYFLGRGELILTLQDGKRLRLFVNDSYGSVTGNGPIQ